LRLGWFDVSVSSFGLVIEPKLSRKHTLFIENMRMCIMEVSSEYRRCRSETLMPVIGSLLKQEIYRNESQSYRRKCPRENDTRMRSLTRLGLDEGSAFGRLWVCYLARDWEV
jgi:hypothetical protein